MSTIYIVDIVLLVILYLLIMFMCGYSAFCVYRILRSMQMRILLRPTRVVFSHKKEGESTEELRTVVAYQNPFTGDYCVHKSRLGHQGYVNSLPVDSPDSGLSDRYEPLNLEEVAVPRSLTGLERELERLERMPDEEMIQPHLKANFNENSVNRLCGFEKELARLEGMPDEMEIIKLHSKTRLNDNSLNRSWNWNYKEYQI